MPEIWKPSVTVAAIIAEAGRYLMVEEQTGDGLRLNQPAGHLEPGESLYEAVTREALEESGRIFTPAGLQGVYLSASPSAANGQLTTYLRFAFVGVVGPRLADRALDTGIVRTLWLTTEEVRASRARHRSPLVLQCIEDHHAGKAAVGLDTLYTHPSALARYA